MPSVTLPPQVAAVAGIPYPQAPWVKAVVPETVFPHGYAVLNADDDLVYRMKNDLKCNIALFSMDENNPRIKEGERHEGAQVPGGATWTLFCA